MPGSDDAELLFAAVREAGAMALALRRAGVRSWDKPDGSPVSEGDVVVDRFLHERLALARPDHGWLSEETPDDEARLSRRALWIADPIDGTRAFIKGTEDWCVAVALVRDGKAVAAAIHRPATDEFYGAVAGGGATRNGHALRIADHAGIVGARVAGPRRALAVLEPLGAVAHEARDIALQLRLAAVATGAADAAVSLGRKNDWDVAAGELLVREAGGTVSDSTGQAFVYNRPAPWQQGLIAAGPRRHAALVQALRGL